MSAGATRPPERWCDSCWTRHPVAEHVAAPPATRAKRFSGPASSGSRRGPGEWLGDVVEAIVDFFTSLLRGSD